jgi:hypothetical protein
VETGGLRWWRLICPGCRQPVRRLFLPAFVLATEGPVPWSCRKSAGVCYARSGRRGKREMEKRRLLALKALARALKAMKADLARRITGPSGR